MKILIVIGFLSCIVIPGFTQQGEQCYTPTNDIGQCLALNSCTSAVNALNTYPRNIAFQYLSAAQQSCGYANFGSDPVVCCNVDQAPEPVTASPGNPFLQNVDPAAPARVTKATTQKPKRKPAATQRAGPKKPSKSCRGPDLLYGTCKPLANCQPLITRLQLNPSDETFASFLRISNEICNNEYAVICCPSAKQPNRQTQVLPKNSNDLPVKLLTMAEGCGYVDNMFRKIVGGKASRVGAWPWISLIGYNDGLSSSASFRCGGALISSRHVITAAHCIRPDLTLVRLGEHDLSTNAETTHIDIPVSKAVKHPQYDPKTGHNDIALLYLRQSVQFTAKITPICLPITPQLRKKSFVNRTPFVAGWGKTTEGGQSATVLQELQIPVYANSVCKQLYKKHNKLVTEQQFNDGVICAGDLGGGKDTCQGDSGGPLMTPEAFSNSVRFHLIGVVSYGIGCARPELPGVYTRVVKYIDWIRQGVADTPKFVK